LLLASGKEARDRDGWGALLWWITKITPAIAILCLVSIAVMQGDRIFVWVWLALGLFVLIALPLKIRWRRLRLRSGRE
jgi:hypothetical protein